MEGGGERRGRAGGGGRFPLAGLRPTRLGVVVLLRLMILIGGGLAVCAMG